MSGLALMLLSCARGPIVEPDISAECYHRPQSLDAVCYVITDSDIAPYVDVVTFLKVDGYLKFKSAEQYVIARPGGVTYSDGGKYLAESFTEEGHPHFIFYDADVYFASLTPESSGFLEDYYLQAIESFSDAGVFTYSIDSQACDANRTGQQPCRRSFQIKAER